MIGLLIVVIVVLYVMLSQYVVSKVYEKTKSIKKKNIAIAIMILIPTWDVILGFPIYAYLCAFESGTKIYKTVDNVEGFYVGERGIKYEPHEPYEGYKYIVYKEMDYSRPTGKYYRSYWVDYYKDRNATQLCVYPRYPKNLDDPYTKAVNNGRCIAKEEIVENEISRFEYTEKSKTKTKFSIIDIRLDSIVSIKDRNDKSVLSEVVSVVWKGGWLYGFLSSISVGNSWKVRCPRIIDIKFNEYIHNTLKAKKVKSINLRTSQ